MLAMHQHHQSPPPPPSSSASSLRSPAAAVAVASQLPSTLPLSLGLDNVIALPMAQVNPSGEFTALPLQPLARVKLSDILPYDGAPAGCYLRAVDALSGSLMRHNAAVIELGSEDAAVLRCGIESARFYFKTRVAAQGVAAGNTPWKGNRGVYTYRAGR